MPGAGTGADLVWGRTEAIVGPPSPGCAGTVRVRLRGPARRAVFGPAGRAVATGGALVSSVSFPSVSAGTAVRPLWVGGGVAAPSSSWGRAGPGASGWQH